MKDRVCFWLHYSIVVYYSAADLYIIKHLDNYLKRANKMSLLCRIYQTERRAFTVANEVKKYCLLDDDESKFRLPTREDIQRCRIVITTVTTSLALAQ